MLEQQSRELTYKILSRLNVKNISSTFSEINPSILKVLELVYLQARSDAENNVSYEKLKSNSIYFQNK